MSASAARIVHQEPDESAVGSPAPTATDVPGAPPRPANRIRELRELNRWSQRELASRMGITGPEVHKLENGQRRLTAAYVEQLAGIFGCAMEEITGQARRDPADTQTEILAALLRIERLLGLVLTERGEEGEQAQRKA